MPVLPYCSDPGEAAFQRRYGPWVAWAPAQAAELLSGWDRPWWVVGGQAIDAFSGTLRTHEDLDVGVLRAHIPSLHAYLGEDWHCWAAGSGNLRPLTPDDVELPEWSDQCWVRRHAWSFWVLDVITAPDEDGAWVYRRDRRVVLPLEQVLWDKDGIRYQQPQIVLAFKAKAHRPKDTFGLECAWPLMNEEQRAWLREAPSRARIRATPGCGGWADVYAGTVMLQDPALPRAYFDHAATTPVLPEVLDVLVEQLRRLGNPSSLHASGREARRVAEESRESIAHCLGARPGDVVFTSGGTEADNLAVKGIAAARRVADPASVRVLGSSVEHHAVLDSLEWLAGQGFDVRLLDVDEVGRVRIGHLRDLLTEAPGTVALVSCMWANNEVGTIQPLGEVVALAREAGVPVHSDAVQAVSHVAVDFTASGLDAMTVTAHKLGGPVGVGALLIRRELDVSPIIHGGGQERQVRSGTLDAPSIAAFARALEIAVGVREQLHDRLEALRAELVQRVVAAVPDVVVNGDPRPGSRLPGIAHLAFPGCEGDSLLMLLDAAGIECSTGSACTAGVPQPSHVLLAMGQPEAVARGSLRFSLGHTSTRADVDRLVAVLPGAVERARAAAGFLSPGVR